MTVVCLMKATSPASSTKHLKIKLQKKHLCIRAFGYFLTFLVLIFKMQNYLIV